MVLRAQARAATRSLASEQSPRAPAAGGTEARRRAFGGPDAWEISTHHRPAEAKGVTDPMTAIQTSFDASTSAEELAYMLLEEARLQCRLLLGDEHDVDGDAEALTLNGLYGDLGIAGYYASARLEPDRRRQLLEHARARCARAVDASELSVRGLTDVTAAATRSVERALTITGLLDHMHVAHIHVMSACETLDAMFALQP
jgi:hypothetical protein